MLCGVRMENKAIDCAICGGVASAVLSSAAALYPKRPDLHHLKCYICPCGASVGCHKDTDRPLGNTADAATKRARNRAHAAFDPIWRNGWKKRSQAYAWLAKLLEIPKAQCHIGLFNVEQCDQVVQHAERLTRALQTRQQSGGMGRG